MSFLPNIPQANDQLSLSQGNILNNFQLLGAIAGNGNPSSASIDDSVGVNLPAGFKWIYLQPQGSTPPAGSAFTAGNVAMYSASNSTTSKNELYITKQNQATTVQIPATASILSITSAPASNSGSWTYLPSGLIMKSGNQTGAFSGLTTTNIAGAPVFTQILSVMVCPYNGSSTGDLNFAVRLVDITGPTTFRTYISSRTSTGAASGQTGFQYIVIGY